MVARGEAGAASAAHAAAAAAMPSSGGGGSGGGGGGGGGGGHGEDVVNALLEPMPLTVASPFDACSELERRRVQGRIVIAQRGSCTFEAKARFAAAAGGVGLLVVGSDARQLMLMSAEEQEPGSEAAAPHPTPRVAIPVALIGREAGELLLHLVHRVGADTALPPLRARLVLSSAAGTSSDAPYIPGAQQQRQQQQQQQQQQGPPQAVSSGAMLLVRAAGNWSVQSMGVSITQGQEGSSGSSSSGSDQAASSTTWALALVPKNASGW